MLPKEERELVGSDNQEIYPSDAATEAAISYAELCQWKIEGF